MTDARTQSRRNAMGVLLTGALTLPAAVAAARSLPPASDVQALHDEWRRLEEIAENSESTTYEEKFDRADEALKRFIAAPVATLWDVLLKLQLIDEMESYSEWCVAHPDDPFVAPRVVVNMIRDLRAHHAGRAI